MYYIVFGLLYLVSLLPLWLLYALSDFLYFITYRVAGYRKEIVFKNLAIAFPEKTAEERKQIAKEFYHRFWDNWIEAVKLLSMPASALRRRVTADMEALEALHQSGRPCHILLGHMFNWEWGNAIISMYSSHKLLCVYAPQSSKIIDRLFLYMRRRFGAVLLPFNDMRRALLPYRHSLYALALMADQSPPGVDKSYWVNFFGRPTAFLQGPEKGARLGSMPVIFLSFSRPKRGHYHMHLRLLADNARLLPETALTRMYVEALQENIRQNPSGWLWSHRRWKHEWKPEYGAPAAASSRVE